MFRNRILFIAMTAALTGGAYAASKPEGGHGGSAAGATASIAANPFLSFTTVATESGRIDFTWTGDNGFAANETAQITVE